MALLNFAGSPHGGAHKLLPEWQSQPKITPTTIIDHSIVGSAAGAYYYFRDNTGIESHFIVGLDGIIWQLMDTGRQADANLNANSFGISIETADNGDPDNFPWTSQQLASLKWLHAKLRAVHSTIPSKKVTSCSGGGLGYHSLCPTTSSNPWTPSAGKSCPGKPVRVAQWNEILVPAFVSGVPLEEGVFMALTDAEQERVLKAADQILGAVGAGQISFSTTIEGILRSVQALINENRSQTSTLGQRIENSKDAVLGALATIDTGGMSEAEREQLAQRIAELDDDLEADAVVDALATRLQPAV